MTEKIIEEYKKLKLIVSTFIEGGKENKDDFIGFVKEWSKEFVEVLKNSEGDKED